MNYDIVSLGDVCEFLDNQRVPITESDRKPGPYPYYGANGQQDSIDNYIFDEPLVLLAEDGGYFGSKDRPIAYKVTGKCWVNNHAHVLRPKSDIDVDYLHRVLSYYDVTKYVNGTTRQKLTKGNAENISFPLPPLTEQKRIASLLARADRLRQLRRTAHDLGDALLQSVFLEMFGDFNRYEKVLFDELAIKSKNSFANGPFGSNLLTTELVSKGVPVLYIRDISSGYYQRVSKAFVTPQKAKELESCRADGGDVLIAKVGDPPGTAAVYPISEPSGIISQDVIRIKPNREIINPEYLARFINSEVGRNILKPILVEGTRERFGLTPMKQLSVPLPPLSLQEEFAGVVARVELLRGRMGESERQVKGLFESLLAEAFS